MTPKRKKSNTPTKEKSLKYLRRKWEERENHIKNVPEKIFKKYSSEYDENKSQLKKINLDFILSKELPTEPTMNPIEKLSGLYICPRIYATFKDNGENLTLKWRDRGVTPGILLESIISPFFESQDMNINKIIIKENNDEPHRYDIIDEFGRIIYIKLYTKGKVEDTKSKTGALLKYLKNKKAFDELIFDEYIEQFKKGFDSYIKSLKTKISIKKPDHGPVLEECNPKGKELRIALCKKPGFYGVALEYGLPETGYSILYFIPKNAGLSKITNTIIKTIPEIKFHCKTTGIDISKIPIDNKGFKKNYFKYFKNRFKQLLEKLPDNYGYKNKY